MKQFPAKKRLHVSVIMLLAAVAFLSIGCKKNNDNSIDTAKDQYYARFKANGVQQEYRSDHRVGASASDVPTHPVGPTSDYYSFGMDAYGDPSLAYPNIQFQIRVYKPLKLDSVYKTMPADQKSGEVYLYYLEKVSTFEKFIGYTNSQNVQIKFTERTGVYIKGTFSGTVYTGDNAKKVEITEGEFYALRAN